MSTQINKARKDLQRRILRDVGKLGVLFIFFAEGTVAFVIAVASKLLFFLYAAVAGFVLYGIRRVLRESFHVLQPIVVAVLTIINTAVNLIIDGVDGLAKAVRAVSFGHVHFHVPSIDIVGAAKVVTDALGAFTYCDAKNVDTMEWEVFYAVKEHTHNVCAVIRYTYPVDFLYEVMDGALGWLVYDPDPSSGPGCTRPPFYTFCFIMNLYLLVQLIVILTFAYLFLRSYWKTIRYFLVQFLLPFLLWIFHGLYRLVSRLIRANRPQADRTNP